ncbi:MAG: hypothetical protein KJO18_00115 [Acidimicrobiia bacterium]|nr:hypothetical protein [Acidimicrobiia bacterium]RZV42477.1 MAG: hypothetical protein EX269_14800 [Acidimicrobiales bacterium]
MDTAVALVQAYLHVNGYFTVAEYPVLEAMNRDNYRTLTDIDLLAYRLPHAGGLVPAKQRGAKQPVAAHLTDPILGVSEGGPDLLIAEVKEGRAVLNQGARSPGVLKSVLVRFGCCRLADLDDIVAPLMHRGHVRTKSGSTIRLVAFGSAVTDQSGGYLAVPLDHVVGFLQTHLQSHWSYLRQAQIKDAAFGFLVALEKARRAGMHGAVDQVQLRAHSSDSEVRA